MSVLPSIVTLIHAQVRNVLKPMIFLISYGNSTHCQCCGTFYYGIAVSDIEIFSPAISYTKPELC